MRQALAALLKELIKTRKINVPPLTDPVEVPFAYLIGVACTLGLGEIIFKRPREKLFPDPNSKPDTSEHFQTRLAPKTSLFLCNPSKTPINLDLELEKSCKVTVSPENQLKQFQQGEITKKMVPHKSLKKHLFRLLSGECACVENTDFDKAIRMTTRSDEKLTVKESQIEATFYEPNYFGAITGGINPYSHIRRVHLLPGDYQTGLGFHWEPRVNITSSPGVRAHCRSSYCAEVRQGSDIRIDGVTFISNNPYTQTIIQCHKGGGKIAITNSEIDIRKGDPIPIDFQEHEFFVHNLSIEQPNLSDALIVWTIDRGKGELSEVVVNGEPLSKTVVELQWNSNSKKYEKKS